MFAAHRGLAGLCARSTWIRHLVRGKPSVLVRDGRIIERALEREGVSREELMAGLRKLGYDSPDPVKLAVLEETGHISAVGADPDRAEAMARAYFSGAYTMAEIGAHSGVHYMTMSRAVKALEQHKDNDEPT